MEESKPTMDKIEAKRILTSYNPRLLSGDDVQIRSALEIVESDPELKAWFDEEREFDVIFSDRLRAIQPPVFLKQAILDQYNASAELSDADTSKRSKLIFWKPAVIVPLAASIVALMAVAVHLVQSQNEVAKPSLDQLVLATTHHADQFDGLEFVNSDLDSVQKFLAAQSAPVPTKMPRSISDLESIGCLSFIWQGSRVGLICLRDDEVYHLYIADRDAIQIPQNQKGPKVQQSGNRSIATWTEDAQVFILMVDGKPDQLARFL